MKYLKFPQEKHFRKNILKHLKIWVVPSILLLIVCYLIRPLHVSLGFPHDKQGHHRQSVKYPYEETSEINKRFDIPDDDENQSDETLKHGVLFVNSFYER